jgi:hypothetical protein
MANIEFDVKLKREGTSSIERPTSNTKDLTAI